MDNKATPASSGSTAARINKQLYRDYRNELGKLTFNSKPIINDLSKRAEASIADAESVVTAIENHLRFIVPKQKLPAFYLLDSIIKNVGGMYVSLLHGRIGKIFIEMWTSVDDEVKAKMERTLRTWRHGFEGGHRNVFPDFVLRKIEEDLARLKAKARGAEPSLPAANGDDLLENLTTIQSFGKKRVLEQQQESFQREVAARADRHSGNRLLSSYGDSQPSPHKRLQRGPEQPKVLHNQGLLQEVNKVLLKKQVELLRRPSDVVLFTILNTLKEIKATVAETDLPHERIEEIRRQLVELDVASSGPSSPVPNGNGSRSAQNGSQGHGQGFPGEGSRLHRPDAGSYAAAPGSRTPPYPPPAHLLNANARRSSQPRTDAAPATSTHTTGSPTNGQRKEIGAGRTPVGTISDTNQLLHNLMSRPDLVNSLSKVAPGLSTSLGALLVPQSMNGPTGYTDFSQLEPIPLTHVSIARIRPGLFNILYQGYPKLCSQCGWRTADSSEGRDLMKRHLDWHFRRNLRSQSERVHRAPPRGWYSLQSTWEAAAEDDDAAAGASGGKGGEQQSKEDGGAGTAEELRRLTVRVPPGHTNEPCAICREPFERRFNEDEEEWALINAVSVGGAIYHATCHAKRAESGGSK